MKPEARPTPDDAQAGRLVRDRLARLSARPDEASGRNEVRERIESAFRIVYRVHAQGVELPPWERYFGELTPKGTDNARRPDVRRRIAIGEMTR